MTSRPIRIVAGVVVALVLFGAGFFAGTSRTGSTTATGPAASSAVAAARRGPFGGADAAGAANRSVVNGQILSVNAESITVQVRTAGQGGAAPSTTSRLVLVGPTTRVVRTTETDVKLSDLVAGDQITAAGTTDAATGSVSAQAIVLGGTTVFADLLGGARRGASPSPGPTR